MDLEKIFLEAAKRGSLKDVEQGVKEGINLEVYDDNSRTALSLAARNGHVSIVRHLLASGALVDTYDGDGFTPLHLAAYKGHKSIVLLLLDHNADPRATNNLGRSPLHYCKLLDHAEIISILAKEVSRPKGKGKGKTPRKDKDNRTSHTRTRVRLSQSRLEQLISEAQQHEKDHLDLNAHVHAPSGDADELEFQEIDFDDAMSSSAGSYLQVAIEKEIYGVHRSTRPDSRSEPASNRGKDEKEQEEGEDEGESESEDDDDDVDDKSIVCTEFSEAIEIASHHSDVSESKPHSNTQINPNLAINLSSVKHIDDVDHVAISVNPNPKSPEFEAVSDFRDVVNSGKLHAYYESYCLMGDRKLKPAATRLFGRLPSITIKTTAIDLVKWGVWSRAPKGVAEMLNCERYIEGRQVLVWIQCCLKPGKDFLAYMPNGEFCVSHRARIKVVEKAHYLVEVDALNSTSVFLVISKLAVHRLNQPHCFRGTFGRDGVSFEDGISCKYQSPLVKAKLMEAALKMEPIIASGFDFNSMATPTATASDMSMSMKQRMAVKCIIDVIDLDWYYDNSSVMASPNRFRCLDVGRLAFHGHGHCHFHASVVAALMLPFSRILGIEVKYRHGVCWNRAAVADLDDHHFVEVTFLPSLRQRVYDNYRGMNVSLNGFYNSDEDGMVVSKKRLWFRKRGVVPPGSFWLK